MSERGVRTVGENSKRYGEESGGVTIRRVPFAIHATISATAVANSIAIGYYDFGAWVNGWSFPNTYTSGDVPASVISGSWASSFVSMIQQGS